MRNLFSLFTFLLILSSCTKESQSEFEIRVNTEEKEENLIVTPELRVDIIIIDDTSVHKPPPDCCP